MLPLFIIAFLFLAYTIILLYYWYAWKSISEYVTDEKQSPVSFSLVIPARNEEKNIGNLLESIIEQLYPESKREVIVVDDHSTDQTAEIASKFSIVGVIPSSAGSTSAYKKKAIETGIRAAKNDWILATDADCTAGNEWMKTISSFITDKNSVFVAAPVVIDCPNTLLGCFQAMDFLMLQGITGAVVSKRQMSMCNGANIAYQKKSFEEVNGFSGIDDIASGDDMLLMYKIQEKYPDRVHYLKSKKAIVSTAAAGTWKEFFSQRIRWASKARRYQDKRIFPVLALVYLFNLSFVFLTVAAFWNPSYWWWLLAGIFFKALVELPLFSSAVSFFNRKWMLRLFLFFQPLHIIYTIISGTFSQFGKYEWKGRQVK